jgi:hypothetical protein
MTTDQAFAELINNRELCLSIGMSKENYRLMKKRFKDGDSMLTIQTKIQWLEKAGYTYKITWKKP